MFYYRIAQVNQSQFNQKGVCCAQIRRLYYGEIKRWSCSKDYLWIVPTWFNHCFELRLTLCDQPKQLQRGAATYTGSAVVLWREVSLLHCDGIENDIHRERWFSRDTPIDGELNEYMKKVFFSSCFSLLVCVPKENFVAFSELRKSPTVLLWLSDIPW